MRDIRMLPDLEKLRIYNELERKYHGKITTKAHQSGFPAVVVYAYRKPQFITDILSIEAWDRRRKHQRHYTVSAESVMAPNIGTAARSPKAAVRNAAQINRVPLSTVLGATDLKVEDDTDWPSHKPTNVTREARA